MVRRTRDPRSGRSLCGNRRGVAEAMMTENPLITEFLNYLTYERHFSPHTAKCYSADLRQFTEFLCAPEGAPSGAGSGGFDQTGSAFGSPGSSAANATAPV